jgi:hypothetical protein
VSGAAKRTLLALLGVGLAARLVLAFATVGQPYDIRSLEIVASALDAPGDLYSRVNREIDFGDISGVLYRWPYPPAFLPWVWLSDRFSDLSGLPFHGLIQLPAILADVAVALLVQDALARRGAGERARLGAVAIVMLGPTFLATSGYHGQIDSLAILPAVLAVAIWERRPPGRRALTAGALIGVGAALKTIPAIMVLALLPTATSWRERVQLVALAGAVPLGSLVPFIASDPDGVARLADYGGAPGAGGVSLVLQPGLAERWLTDDAWTLSSITQFLVDHGSLLNVAALAVVGVALMRFRPAPTEAALLLWLVVYVVAPGFFLQYLVWGLPFMLMAGYLREAIALQAAILLPTFLAYLAPWEDRGVLLLFVPIMIGLWIGMVVGAFLLARNLRPQRLRAGAGV